ncbi:3'-5' exonuclease, partial [Tulasnella sp. 403]
PGKYIAIDCEMVTAKGGQRSLARVSLVNLFGATVLDTFVRQNAPVVDYKTHVSGVRPRDLSNQSAIPFEDAQKSVRELLKDRILVGHALQHDLKVLKLSHPHYMCRDTSRYSGATGPTPALKSLVQKELGIHIQDGEHDSITDARAAMALYRLRKEDWERPASQNPKTLEEPVEEADHSIAPDDEPGPGLEPGPPDGIHIHVAMNSKTPSKSKRQPGRTANIASKKTKSKLSSAVSQKKGSDDNHPKKRANRNGNSKTNHSSNQGNWWATL